MKLIEFRFLATQRPGRRLRCFALFVAAAVAATAQSSAPERSGIFYKPDDTRVVPLEPVRAMTGRSSSAGVPDTAMAFQGASASLRIPDAKPIFYVRAIPFWSARDCIIVRLDVKGDHREMLATSSGRALTTNSADAPGRRVDFQVVQKRDGDYILMPREPLSPGEYIITFRGAAYSGYDFGIDPPRS